MSNLITDTPEALLWVEAEMSRHDLGIYGHLKPGVIWTDARAADGSLLVEASPSSLVSAFHLKRNPLLRDHDPGRPVGDVLDAASFVGPLGQQFVVAIIGYYAREKIHTLSDMGLADIPAPDVDWLPDLADDVYVKIATDPRDVPDAWIDDVASASPLPVVRDPLSHNSNDTLIELIRIGLPYAVIVWNPFVKSFATEAGKAAYAGVHAWLKSVIRRASERKSPCVCIEGVQNGCEVSYLIRGNDVELSCAAYEGLSEAAAQAARLISTLINRGMPAARLVYEFDAQARRWYPSYAVLDNGRLIANTPSLIAAAADLPAELSVGLTRTDMGVSDHDAQ